jgi:hypothetical protein
MGIAQKLVNAGIAVSSLMLAHAIATREPPSLQDILGGNSPDAVAKSTRSEAEKAFKQFCVSDNFKEACSPDFDDAMMKFATNPRILTPEERRTRRADDAQSRRELKESGSISGTFSTKTKDGNEVFVQRRFEDRTGIHRGQKYKVPPEYAKILRNATQGSPLSFDIMVQLIGSESGFKAHATSETNALGMGQFTGATLREALWNNKDRLSRGAQRVIEKNIERYNSADEGESPLYKYKIKKGGSKDALEKLAKNPEVAIVLACEYGKDALRDGENRYRSAIASRIKFLHENPEKNDDPHRMARLQHHLHRDLTSTDLKIIYMAGPRGGSKILFAYADSKNLNQRASDYTADIVTRGNPNVFFKDEDRKVHRSVAEVYNYFIDRVGNIPVVRTAAARSRTPTASI